MSTAEAVKATCNVCGYVTEDPSMLELWEGYGECVGLDHEDGAVQHSTWVTADGKSVEVHASEPSLTLHAEKGEACTSCGRPVTLSVRISNLPGQPDIDRWMCERCSPVVLHPQPGTLTFGPRTGRA